MRERQAGGPSVPGGGLQRAHGDGTTSPLSAVCKEALSCCMVDTSRPTGLLTGLGFWWLQGCKKLVEGPKPPPG